MAILTSSNLISEQRYGVDDARRVESGVRNDFDTTVSSIFTNTSQGYVVRGFNLLTAGAIGSPANGLQMQVDPGAVLHIKASVSGTIFQTPLGTANQTLNAATNTNVSGSFTASSTNYVGIDYNRFADSTTNVTKFIWSASSNDEIETIAPAAQTLTYKIYITTSTWAANVLPVAIVTTDSNGNVTSITDARWNMYALGTGGLSPNPNFHYPWSAGRTQSPVTTTSNSIDPFVGGDKQLTCFKDWANAMMTTLLEVKGTPYWFSDSSGGGSLPSLISLFQDLGNTVITGSGQISNGILPNATPILSTTGNITAGSNQLTSLASVAGLANGDYIFGTGIPAYTTILSIVGSTVTMSQPATLNGTGIGVAFYEPSVITAPGQINWDKDINIHVVGSSLTYKLSANASSTDITLSDDQVAYITLIRDQAITPNLVFTGGSPIVTSVGAVSWTTGLLAGDYIKVATNTVSGYYKILTVDSTSQVTLTSNAAIGDNTGPAGAQAQYAFGSYTTSPSPSTNRHIHIANRGSVPVAGNVFWLFMREDNGGDPRVYIRFLSQELDNGQSVEVSGTTSQELLRYIGSPSAVSSKPQYVSSLDPGSIPQITSVTVGSAATLTSNQYFNLYSSFRRYYVWVNKNGTGVDPQPFFGAIGIQWPVSTGQTSTQTASALAVALQETFFQDFSATSGVGTVTITNNSAGTTTSPSNFNVGAPFAVSISQSGTGQGNYGIQDGQNLTLAIKKIDEVIGSITEIKPGYDETVTIVTSGATPPTSLNGPVSPSTNIQLPPNSRDGSVQVFYGVGSGKLEVFLNGQKLIVGNDYTEVGSAGAPSDQIQTLRTLVVGDELEFLFGGGNSGSGGGQQGPPGSTGPQGPIGFNAAGGPVPVSVKTSSYSVLTSDCFLAADCTSGNIVFTLPPSSGNTGRIFYFKKIDASANTLTIIGSGADVVEFGTLPPFTAQGQSGSFIADGGTQYYIY